MGLKEVKPVHSSQGACSKVKARRKSLLLEYLEERFGTQWAPVTQVSADCGTTNDQVCSWHHQNETIAHCDSSPTSNHLHPPPPISTNSHQPSPTSNHLHPPPPISTDSHQPPPTSNHLHQPPQTPPLLPTSNHLHWPPPTPTHLHPSSPISTHLHPLPQARKSHHWILPSRSISLAISKIPL